MAMDHYLPANRFKEESVSENQFYNRQEFKRRPLGPTL